MFPSAYQADHTRHAIYKHYFLCQSSTMYLKLWNLVYKVFLLLPLHCSSKPQTTKSQMCPELKFYSPNGFNFDFLRVHFPLSNSVQSSFCHSTAEPHPSLTHSLTKLRNWSGDTKSSILFCFKPRRAINFPFASITFKDQSLYRFMVNSIFSLNSYVLEIFFFLTANMVELSIWSKPHLDLNWLH